MSPEYPGAIPIVPEPPSAVYVFRKKLSPANDRFSPAKNPPFISVLGFIVISIQAIDPGSTITDSPSFKFISISEYEGAQTMSYFISSPSVVTVDLTRHPICLDRVTELIPFHFH